MQYSKAFFLILLVCSGKAFSEGGRFTIEDAALRSINGRIYEVISKDPSFSPFENLGCKLTGRKIPLTPLLTVSVYFVTTSNACGWGAALGPIWLVDESSGKMILNAGGYAVEVKRHVRNGFRDVGVSSGTAGGEDSNYYHFNGARYVLKKNRVE